MIYSAFIFIILVKLTIQDVYMHNPRGSNNRLNEQAAARNNNNRLFNSQNNARGGYNVGDATNVPFQTEDQQYQMRYFQSGSTGQSYLKIEWTNQHGCGGNEYTNAAKQNCFIIIQYMCNDGDITNLNDVDRLRDGLNTNSQVYTQMGNDALQDNINRKLNDVDLNRGLQEPWQWYDKCNYRQRNTNLFTADQKLGNNNKGYSSAVFTRQNPNGGRSGYECPEERDYYPYWHPTMWKDIAVLTSNITLCQQYYNTGSFNVQPYNECVQYYVDGTIKHWSRYNTKTTCEANNGTWATFYNYLEIATQFTTQKSCEANGAGFKWAIPYSSNITLTPQCLVLLNAPICQQADWTRSNHLGNTLDGEPSSFTWALPRFPSGSVKKCALRIRYNVTTDDYDSFGTDATSNGQQNSPVLNDPQVEFGVKNVLQLNINTAQYGRVFQDRSHSFLLLPRTNEISDNVNIYNLNVRGKRGNIVQVYPAVEYDFIPNKLTVKPNDLIHVQWTGSNTHNNNGNNGGDGQTGDDGNGKTGTDRSNFVQVNTLSENYATPYEMCNIWSQAQIIGLLDSTKMTQKPFLIKNSALTSKDYALFFSSAGYYQCVQAKTCTTNSFETLTANASNVLDADLNTADASFPGALVRFPVSSSTSFYYMCSRNNNFSNRSQKGKINVVI